MAMLKLGTKVVAVVLIGLLASVSMATLSGVKDSATFDYNWEMDYFPWNPVYCDEDGDGLKDWTQSSSSHFTASDGILINTNTTSGWIGSNKSNWGGIWPLQSITAATGYTTEFSIKIVTSSGENGAFKLQINPTGSTLTDIISIGASDITWWDSTGGGKLIVLDTGDNTDGFHKFRVARHVDDPTKTSVWKDGVLIGDTLTVTYTLALPNRFVIGDIDSSVNGTFQVDYLRFTSGAWAVPEPATVALFCLGAILFRRK